MKIIKKAEKVNKEEKDEETNSEKELKTNRTEEEERIKKEEELRLKQEYFFSSASVQNIVSEFKKLNFVNST